MLQKTVAESRSPGPFKSTGEWWGNRTDSRCLGKKSLNRKSLLQIIILFLSLYKSQSTKSPPRGNYYQFCSTETDFNCPVQKKTSYCFFKKSAYKLLLVLTEGISFSIYTEPKMLLSLRLAPMFIKSPSQFLVRAVIF